MFFSRVETVSQYTTVQLSQKNPDSDQRITKGIYLLLNFFPQKMEQMGVLLRFGQLWKFAVIIRNLNLQNTHQIVGKGSQSVPEASVQAIRDLPVLFAKFLSICPTKFKVQLQRWRVSLGNVDYKLELVSKIRQITWMDSKQATVFLPLP